MADQSIIMPRIWAKRGNTRQETLGGQTGFPNDAGVTFLAKSIVVYNRGTGTLTSDNTAPSDGDTVTIGTQTYTFKTALTPTVGQVLINTTADAALLNLIRAINGTGTAGTDYASGTPVNPFVSAATSVTAHAFVITARDPSIVNVATTETSAHLSFGAATLQSGGLCPVATAGVLACGIVPDASNTDTTGFTVNPPYDLYGNNHYPFDLHGLQFLINIGTLSGSAAVVGGANSAKQLKDVAIGSTYGIARATTGTYAGYQFLDPSNTSQLLLTVVDKPSLRNVIQASGAVTQQTADTYNALVVAEIAGSLLQSLD